MIQEIKSRDNSLIKYVNKLKDNSFSKEEKKFIIEGIHLVEMAKNNLLYVLTEKKLDEKMYPNLRNNFWELYNERIIKNIKREIESKKDRIKEENANILDSKRKIENQNDDIAKLNEMLEK